MKEMTWFAVDLERTVNRLETEKSLLIKRIEELVSCPSQTTMVSGQISDELLKHTASG